MIRDSLEEIIVTLDRAFALFASRGLSSVGQHSWFAHHRRVLVQAIELLKDAIGEEWRRAEATFIQEKRLIPYSSALNESQEVTDLLRSEERRVGKESRDRGW